MEEILKVLQTIRLELDDQRVAIRENGKNVTEQVTQNINKILEEKFFALEEKHEKLKELVESQAKRIYYLEKQARQRNIVVFGLEELETSYDTFEKNVLDWIQHHFSIKLSYSDLQEVKRLGEKGDKPRPVVVTFLNLGLKIKIFKQRNALQDSGYYITEDYPKYVLEKRKQLQEQLKAEREKGNTAFIKYDKLVILKQTFKRKLSTSPIISTEDKLKETKKQTINKNKPQNAFLGRRSNSISEGVNKPCMLNFLINKNNKTTQKTVKNKP